MENAVGKIVPISASSIKPYFYIFFTKLNPKVTFSLNV